MFKTVKESILVFIAIRVFHVCVETFDKDKLIILNEQ